MLRPSISVGAFTDTALQTIEQPEEEEESLLLLLLMLMLPEFLVFLNNLKEFVVVGPTQVVFCLKVRGEASVTKSSDLELIR